MAVDMPAIVPIFHVDGHTFAEDDQYAHLQFGLGHTRSRRVRTRGEQIYTVRQLLEPAQMLALVDWHEYDLEAGSLIFNAQVKSRSDSGLETVTARWLSFSIQIMHLGRGMLSGAFMVVEEEAAAAAELPDIDDIAMDLRIEPWRETVFEDGDYVGELSASVAATDWSGNNHVMGGGGGGPGPQPIYKVNIVNGRAVYRFDGVDDYLKTANMVTGIGNSASRWYYVVRAYRSIPGGVTVDWRGYNSDTDVGTNQGDAGYYSSPNQVTRFAGQGTTKDDKTSAMSGAGVFTLNTMFADGANVVRNWAADTNTIAQPTPHPNGTYVVSLGASPPSSPANFAPVDIALFFCGHQILTTDEKTRIAEYIDFLFDL